MDNLVNKKILLIICGGISAYKSLELIRSLKKKGVEIKTILTKSGKEFVTALSISSLSREKVYEDLFSVENEAEMDHISLSRWADLVLVAPITANTIAKLSSGSSDDLASAVILASNKEVFLAPAMNIRMWEHPTTKENVNKLKKNGFNFIGPEIGDMACGEFGEGKMSSPRQIFAYLKNYFDKKNIVKNKNFKALVTTGPTREYLDPVRYISNESSGKQGYEIAIALDKLGIKTTLISGPSNFISPKSIKVKKITSADEMLSEVKKTLPVDLAVCAAAVADFKPIQINKNKLKKDKLNFESINFIKNNDILEFISKNNKSRPRIVAGFSAETHDGLGNSIKKLKNKHCDFIFANDVSKKDIGFNSDFNKVSVIDKTGKIKSIKKNKKSLIANIIAQILLDKLIDDRNIN
mgnify:CR=1 FL=1